MPWAYNYKYANAGSWWKYDYPHAVSLIGKGDGTVVCALAASNAPGVEGTVTATALAGSQVRAPRWIEFRCSDIGAGHPGEGTIRVITSKYGGGINWGVTNN